MKYLLAAFNLPLLALAQSAIICSSATPPANSVAVHIVFNAQLNWDFVSTHAQSASQICTLTPQGVAYGLDVAQSAVLVTQLQPQTASGYTATRAVVYIPAGEVQEFDTNVHVSTSRFYNNPNTSVDSLMDMVDPSASGA